MGWNPIKWVKDEVIDPVVDVVQDAGDWINEEIVDPITDVVSDIPVVGDVTGAIEDHWKEDVRPWASEALTAAGSAIGGPVGGAIGGALGTAIEGGNSDEILVGAVSGGVESYIGQVASGGGFGVGLPSGASATEALGAMWDATTDAVGNAVGYAKDFISAPFETIAEAFPSLGELGETAVEKLKAELGRLPENAANAVIDIIRGGGDAANEVVDAISSGNLDSFNWQDLIGAAGAAYASDKAAKIQADAINKATEAQLTAARESMDLQRELTREGMGLTKELAERGFDFQERGMRLGGSWREAGMGALNELSQLQGLGALTNNVDPYTGKPLNDSAMAPQTLGQREALQKEAMSRFKTSPGYEFRQAEGAKAIDRLASARGYMGSTRAAKEAQRYGEGLAAQEYDAYVNRLSSMAGIGAQSVGSGVSAAGGAASLAGQTGSQMGGTLSTLGTNLGRTATGAGDARASGYLTAGTYGASNWANLGNLWQEVF